MKAILLAAVWLSFYTPSPAQQTDSTQQKKLLAQLSDNACKCLDSISVYNKTKEDITKEINDCVSRQAAAYEPVATSGGSGNQEIKVSLRLDENQRQYGRLYDDIENYLMDHCNAVRQKITAWNQQQKKSFSDDPQAREYFTLGMNALTRENYTMAIDYFQQAVTVDNQFAFAWDNLGLCFRKTGDYDNALMAYNKSLAIDPKGLMPLQNIAIVYQYQKDYGKAIEAFQKIAEIDPENPEIYYGIGNIYTNSLNEDEKGLDNMCKAYNLYNKQKSPYTADAARIIQSIYTDMKKHRKLRLFNEILQQNNITPM